MNDMLAHHRQLGASLAADGIPLHYGDQADAYEAALNAAVLLDRSHEARVLLSGESRFDFINRMTTNEMLGMAGGEGRATVFVNANARILCRVVAYNCSEGLLLFGGPGQGADLTNLLRRNIFYGDDVRVADLQADTAQFSLHGPMADAVMQALSPSLRDLPDMRCADIETPDASITVARDKSVVGSHWRVICPSASAVSVHHRLLSLGEDFGLRPAGSLLYHVVRLRAGQPAGVELSRAYIPLEVGLWDEVSFDKGCYTGQEIIARMESRRRLAKALVTLDMADLVDAPAPVYADGRVAGNLTSSALSPRGEIFSLAVIRTAAASPGAFLTVGDNGTSATVKDYAGVQPAFVTG